MKRFFLFPVTLAAIGFCGAVSAQGYVGGQVGASRSDYDCNKLGDSCDKSDTAFKLYGGYKLTPEWALEVAYSDLGKTKVTEGTDSFDVEHTSFGFGGAYHLAFNTDWNGVGRFGIARNKAKAPGTSTSKTEPYLGLGVGYVLSKELTLIGSWDWTRFEIKDPDSGATEKSKANSFSVGLNYAF